MGKITYNKDQEEDKMSAKTEYAVKLHKNGCNCAQAVACTFCKEFGIVPDRGRIWTWHGRDGDVRCAFRNGNDHWSG